VSDYVTLLLEQHRSRGAVIDANLLLLALVGEFDPTLVGRAKHLRQYDQEDLVLVQEIRRYFPTVVTTPNLLTEVSNLAGHLPDGVREGAFAAFRSQFEILNEQYVASTTAAGDPQFAAFGLSDSGIAHVAQGGGYLVVTDDLRLASLLDHRGLGCVNINHLRSRVWLS
jgi:hypothetical protein